MHIQFLNSAEAKKQNNIIRKINEITFIIFIIIGTIGIYKFYSSNASIIEYNKQKEKENKGL